MLEFKGQAQRPTLSRKLDWLAEFDFLRALIDFFAAACASGASRRAFCNRGLTPFAAVASGGRRNAAVQGDDRRAGWQGRSGERIRGG